MRSCDQVTFIISLVIVVGRLHKQSRVFTHKSSAYVSVISLKAEQLQCVLYMALEKKPTAEVLSEIHNISQVLYIYG